MEKIKNNSGFIKYRLISFRCDSNNFICILVLWMIALKSVIPTKVPTLSLTIMMSMFEGCSPLVAIDLTKYDVSQVNNIDHLLTRCKSVKAIDFSWNSFQNIASAN